MATECELKLELPATTDPEALRALLALGPSRVTKMRAVYFDTPDFALASHDCSLRIRQEGRRRVQTVKAGGEPSSGLMTRQEYEQPAKGQTPSLDADNPVTLLLGERVEELAPRFDVAVTRRTWLLDSGRAEIELALDLGEAHAGRQACKFCEVEAELLSGDVSELFLLGRRISRLAPARVGVLTKAQRAQRLLRDPDKVDKAKTVGLRPEMTTGEAFRAVVHSCIAHYRLNESRLLLTDEPEAVHQARVALRRLRTALRIFRPIAGGKRLRRFNDEARWLAAQLGTARDLDVLLDRATEPAARKRIAAARVEAYAHMRLAIESDLARELMIELAEWLTVGKWTRGGNKLRDAPVTHLAARAIGQLDKRLGSLGDAVGGPDDEQRHEARKTAKKLRYAIEFFSRLYDQGKLRKDRIRYLAGLEELQDHLGILNDMAIMPEALHRLGISSDAAEGMAQQVGRVDLLRLQAADAMTAIRDAQPFWN
ncbi:MAG TPA: CHAD domain-containing protein [Sphingobium sp.]|uniref:CYTH and CHAD domain-containing protein n=1 Tax=Sphingobium sp. TaxID=1912891 RepID=UPI002ED2587A